MDPARDSAHQDSCKNDELTDHAGHSRDCEHNGAMGYDATTCTGPAVAEGNADDAEAHTATPGGSSPLQPLASLPTGVVDSSFNAASAFATLERMKWDQS